MKINEKKNNIDENLMIAEFISKFYDMCSGLDASDDNLSKFYDEFPAEMRDMLMQMIKQEKKGNFR
jgi:hypothetical protein